MNLSTPAPDGNCHLTELSLKVVVGEAEEELSLRAGTRVFLPGILEYFSPPGNSLHFCFAFLFISLPTRAAS